MSQHNFKSASPRQSTTTVLQSRYGRSNQSQPWSLQWSSNFVWHDSYYPDGEPTWYRNWDNVSNLRTSVQSKAQYRASLPMKKIIITLHKGPRLGYKILLPNGKYVWARKPIQIYKLVPDYPKKKKGKRGPVPPLTMAPNFLDYFKSVYSYYPDTLINVSNGTEKTVYSGPLWAGISSNGQSLNPNNYYNVSLNANISGLLVGLRAKALARFYAKANNQSVNIGNVLAERRQTSGMIAELAIRIARSFLSLKSGNIVKAASQLFPNSPKGIANDFLVWQYGIKPLLSDLDGAMKQLAIPEHVSFNVTASATEKVPMHVLETHYGAGAITAKTVVSQSYDVTVIYKAHCRVTSAMRNFYRAGLYNPLAIAWEVTPWSFVVDWFLPMGNYLNNMDAFAGTVVDYVTETVFIKQKTTFIRDFGGNSGTGYYTDIGQTGFENEVVSCKRVLLTSVLPDLKFPSFKSPVSNQHFANAVALITQLFSKN